MLPKHLHNDLHLCTVSYHSYNHKMCLLMEQIQLQAQAVGLQCLWNTEKKIFAFYAQLRWNISITDPAKTFLLNASLCNEASPSHSMPGIWIQGNRIILVHIRGLNHLGFKRVMTTVMQVKEIIQQFSKEVKLLYCHIYFWNLTSDDLPFACSLAFPGVCIISFHCVSNCNSNFKEVSKRLWCISLTSRSRKFVKPKSTSSLQSTKSTRRPCNEFWAMCRSSSSMWIDSLFKNKVSTKSHERLPKYLILGSCVGEQYRS